MIYYTCINALNCMHDEAVAKIRQFTQTVSVKILCVSWGLFREIVTQFDHLYIQYADQAFDCDWSYSFLLYYIIIFSVSLL